MIFPLLYFSSLSLKISLFISLSIFFFFINFAASLYYPLPQISARYWHYNLKEAILAAKETNSETIYFSDTAESFYPSFFYTSLTLSPIQAILLQNRSFCQPFFYRLGARSTLLFGRLNWSNLSDLPTESLIVAPKVNQNLFPRRT